MRTISFMFIVVVLASFVVCRAEDTWQSLFDGKKLGDWKQADVGGGNVDVEDGRIVIEFADGVNGIVFGGEVPKTNYELQLQAMRVDGTDFFCGLTFPVVDAHCSLIVGGWGGAVVGLSSIDGKDAARNDTKKLMSFKKGQWYAIKLKVTPQNISAWIDGEQVVDQPLAGKTISIRSEVEPFRPLGIATWQTTGAVREVKLRKMTEKTAAGAEAQ